MLTSTFPKGCKIVCFVTGCNIICIASCIYFSQSYIFCKIIRGQPNEWIIWAGFQAKFSALTGNCRWRTVQSKKEACCSSLTSILRGILTTVNAGGHPGAGGVLNHPLLLMVFSLCSYVEERILGKPDQLLHPCTLLRSTTSCFLGSGFKGKRWAWQWDSTDCFHCTLKLSWPPGLKLTAVSQGFKARVILFC